jgi:hypothetical protein
MTTKIAPRQTAKRSGASLDAVVRQALADRIRQDIANIGCIYGTVGAALWDEPVERLVGRFLASVEATLPNAEAESSAGSEE